SYRPKQALESAQCIYLKPNSNPFDALNTLGEEDDGGVPKPVSSGVKIKSPMEGGKKNLVISLKSKIHYFDSDGMIFDDLDQEFETVDYENG
ncbi:hypothetical protein Tco_1494802, partial [Tanacetum coccineum]